jgi:hypothetical protein
MASGAAAATRRIDFDEPAEATRARLEWPWASLSLSADIHLNMLNNSYGLMYL